MSHEAFLAEILANPDDDIPRLIYADWLEDQGDHRAEFIRLQCERAALPEFDLHQSALREREKQLLNQFGQEWSGSVRKYCQDIEFHRGFVDSVTLRLSDAVDRLPRILNLTPLSTVRFIQTSKGRLSELAHTDCLLKLRKLSFANERLSVNSVRELTASPYLTNIESLDLSASKITDGALRAFGTSPSLSALKELSLQECGITDMGLQVFSSQSAFDRLESLDLSSSQATQLGWWEFFDRMPPPNLKRLIIVNNYLSSHLIDSLIERSALSQLKLLQISSKDVEQFDLARLEAALGDKLAVVV